MVMPMRLGRLQRQSRLAFRASSAKEVPTSELAGWLPTTWSRRHVLAKGLPGVGRAKTAAALEFGHQQVDNIVQRLDPLGLRVTQHEAAAAARTLKAFLELIGDLRGGASCCGGIATGCFEPLLEEVIRHDLAVMAQRLRELCHKTNRRCIYGNDPLIQRLEREARRQRRHIESGVV